jgi:NAD(P)-dependent dehydrogenase (short-subunit alcohol dehydrogenase family)
MTKSMAKEFGSRNVCVNAVCPGFIESDMTKDLNKESLLSFIPLKRLFHFSHVIVASLRPCCSTDSGLLKKLLD